MGQRGPAKRPAALKITEGTFRAHRDGGIPVAIGEPQQPGWLSEQGQEVWQQVVSTLSQTNGLLGTVDGYSLSRYCEDWVDYWTALKAIRTEGQVTTSDSGALYQHPAVGIRNKACERMAKFEAKFGMTPSDRAGMKIENPKQTVRQRTR